MFSYDSILSDISDKDRLGTDLSYEPEFELIEEEIKKSTNLFATSKTDWSVVHDNSLNLLRETSKDYRLLYWLCLSITKRNLAIDNNELIRVINDFIIKFKDDIYPKRKRSLYSSINQIINIITDNIKSIIDNIDNINDTDILITQLSVLDESIESIFENNTDNLSSVISLTKKLKKRLKSETENNEIVAPQSIPSAPTQAPSATSTISFSQNDITNDRDANKAFRHLQDVARTLSKYWLSQKLSDEKVYQLNRTLTWLTISQLPASNDDNVTMLKPVPQARIQYFQQLKAELNHSTLIIEMEESLSKSPFWIDGHFMVWESLTELNHHDAAQSITDQLSLLINKTPSITDLKFDDGTEFASESTKAWIQQQCSTSTHATTSPVNHFDESQNSSDWENAFQEALTLLQQHSLNEVMQPLIRGHHQSRSDREAFFWQFTQAKLLFQSSKYDLANSLFSWLDKQYSQSVLAHWDPILEERLLELWLQCHNKLSKKDQDSQLLAHIRERLCCLNPIRVLN
ncbi:type VI secretion system protein TssA [Aliivibrio fischeri]|uniref:Type VI secretion system protein TssA n=1 Tax=Aliivibrio fischeri TaxID=668 RepID=A0A6N3YWB5_ALIFS|nr:type VI secretion system protein TssA [Aliivibrio fischeri]MUK44596.1 type VI secretion system protein TssA [Aliivibrio fischeri]MUK79821.1 type VI secretion system protein TssA [Aliivibrio fischeri]MUK85667.1 type VI secretion system protein TssA [Aliivibrio fischeri]